jgi:hypothetical protein
MTTVVEWECDYLDWLAGRRPDLTREYFLRNQAGKAMGGPPLESRMARMGQLDALWHRAETNSAENAAANARMTCRIAASVLRQPAPDALAAFGAPDGAQGRQDALTVLRAAGFDPDPVAQRWAEEAPRRQQFSSRAGDIYADDPLHDNRVTEAVKAHGGSIAEGLDIAAEVTAERRRAKQEQLAAAAAAGHDPAVLWTTREGVPLRDGGAANGRPLVPQRSVLRRNVPELGSEQALGAGHAR